MAHANTRKFARSIDLLDRAVVKALRLCDSTGLNKGRVGVLRERLQRAQAIMDAHRKRRPLDKRLVMAMADDASSTLVEFLAAMIEESNKRA